jgi:hypothetical protein
MRVIEVLAEITNQIGVARVVANERLEFINVNAARWRNPVERPQ